MKKSMLWVCSVILLVVAALALGPRSSEDVRIVVPSAPLVSQSLFLVARETARRHGPEKGLSLVEHNHPPSRDRIVSTMKELLDEFDPVAVIDVGPSNPGLLVAPASLMTGVPHVLPMSTSRSLQESSASAFPFLPTDSVVGTFLVKFAAERLEARRISLFYEDSEHGIGVRDGVRSEVRNGPAALLAAAPLAPTGDYGPIIDAALLRGVPDAILLAGGPSVSRVVRSIRERLSDVPILGSDGIAASPTLAFEAPDSDVHPLYLVSFWSRSSSWQCPYDFPGWLDSVAPEASAVAGLVHDAVAVVAEGVGLGHTTAREMQRYLESIGRGRPAFAGATGPVRFGSDAHRPLLIRFPDGATAVIRGPLGGIR